MPEEFVVDDAYYSRACSFFAKDVQINGSAEDLRSKDDTKNLTVANEGGEIGSAIQENGEQVREAAKRQTDNRGNSFVPGSKPNSEGVLEATKRPVEPFRFVAKQINGEQAYEATRKQGEEVSLSAKQKTEQVREASRTQVERRDDSSKKQLEDDSRTTKVKDEERIFDALKERHVVDGVGLSRDDSTFVYGEQIIAKMKKIKSEDEETSLDEVTLADGEEFFAKAKMETVEGFVCALEIGALIKENGTVHKTHKFNMKSQALILRRGATFKLVLTKVENYMPSPNPFVFTLTCVQGPCEEVVITVPKCTHREFGRLKVSKDTWGYQTLIEDSAEGITVEIYIPPNVAPSKYELVVTDNESQKTIGQLRYPVYVLFNPWCADDEVYMKEKSKIREYVMKQSGIIYVGSSEDPRPKKWYYGQFEDVSLEAAFKMLDGFKQLKGGSTAVEICRHFCKKVSSDGHGLIDGNWSEDKRMSAWSSSPIILDSFMKRSLKPIKWGQCYVYSAIMTTVLRAIGIPTRAVTNFNCGHGSRDDLTIHRFLDEDGHGLRGLTRDSIWNFHVWNEVWMERRDLSDRFGGWQALMPKCDNKSKDSLFAGPASVEAVKIGEMNCTYDTSLVFTHVNADTVYKQEDKHKQWEVIKRDVNFVGKYIVTKAIGRSDSPEDITNDYKFHQGSILESATVKQHFPTSVAVNEPTRSFAEDIKLEISADKPTIKVGEDVLVNVTIMNTCPDERELVLVFGGVVMRYNGNVKVALKKHSEQLTATASGTVDVSLMVSVAQYLPYLEEETMIRFVVTATVPTTTQVSMAEQIIYIEKPNIVLTRVPSEFVCNTTYVIGTEFTNPLDVELTECEILVDGSVMRGRIHITDIRNIPPRSLFKHTVKMTAVESIASDTNMIVSTKSLTVCLSSKELGIVSETLKVFLKREGLDGNTLPKL